MLDRTKAVDKGTMDSTLKRLIKSAPNFNPKDVKYVDDNTINGDYGFDFYSWSYWGMSNRGSICAFVTDTYNSYLRFRKLQEQV
jgi:hypothetical protein